MDLDLSMHTTPFEPADLIKRFFRELKDGWDPYLLSFFEMGGNSRFIRFSRKYELDDMPIEDIFRTKISEYYRLLVN